MTTLNEDAPAYPGTGSHYLTPAAARRAIALTAPMIEHAMRDRSVVGSGFLHVVVMDPCRPPGATSFEEAILHEHTFGDRTAWDADYAAFARAKARLSWITGRDGRVLQQQFPHLLRTGDTLLAGGVCLDGIVVAASGAFPWYDEVFAGTVALCLRALAREAREAERDTLKLAPRAPEAEPPSLLRPR
ncbi:hypothetical protein [Aromatoleum buckelii]|uniref:Uncharacterized protein n=1 Tax=Aromatoleum buckelii TaxID=200254 RepID=A0ABX1MZF4_9RHOO|nr:hypothetical protein [Aromatoleum buckelii]MCK0512654.1 hypothetical protein [Aromatoleum buckelii]